MPKYEDAFYEEVSNIIFTDSSVEDNKKNTIINELETIIESIANSFWVDLYNAVDTKKFDKGNNDISINDNSQEYAVEWIKEKIKEKYNSLSQTLYLEKKSTSKTISDVENRSVLIKRYDILLFALLFGLNSEQTDKLLVMHCEEQGWNTKNPMDALVFIALTKEENQYYYWQLLWESFKSFDINSQFFNILINQESYDKNTDEVNDDFKTNLAKLDVSNKELIKSFLQCDSKNEEKRELLKQKIISSMQPELDLVAKYAYLNRERVEVIKTSGKIADITKTFSLSLDKNGNRKIVPPKSVHSWNYFFSGSSIRAKQELERILSLSDPQSRESIYVDGNKAINNTVKAFYSYLLDEKNGSALSLELFYNVTLSNYQKTKDCFNYYFVAKREANSTCVIKYYDVPKEKFYKCPVCKRFCLKFNRYGNGDDWQCTNPNCYLSGDLEDLIIHLEKAKSGRVFSKNEAEKKRDEIVGYNYSKYLYFKIAGNIYSDEDNTHKHQGAIFNEHIFSEQRVLLLSNDEYSVSRDDIIYANLYYYQQFFKNIGTKAPLINVRKQFINSVNYSLQRAGYGAFNEKRAFESFILWSLNTPQPIESIKAIDKCSEKYRITR